MSLDFSKLAKKVDEDARLIILRALAIVPGGELNETIIDDTLQEFGHNRPRAWVRQQISYLNEVGGVIMDDSKPIRIVSITRAGIDHIDRKAILEGVKKPRPEI